MMWNPSVSAIWVRAWASSAASGRLRSMGYLEVAAVAGSAGRSSLQSIVRRLRAVHHLGTAGPLTRSPQPSR